MLIQEPSIFALQRSASRTVGSLGSSEDDNAGNQLNSLVKNTRRLSEWAPFSTDEGIDWYHEYIARHAPLSMSWLPSLPGRHGLGNLEVRGLGLLKKDGKNIIVTPMEDASVCLRDLPCEDGMSMPQATPAVHRSETGILQGFTVGQPAYNSIPTNNASECVSIDQSSHKAYFSSNSTLTEVDLTTLQASARKVFESPICSLSEGGAHPFPVTVGTTKSIHIYDPRDPDSRLSPQTNLADGLTSIDPHENGGSLDFDRLHSGDSLPSEGTDFASVVPSPLSIAHLSHDIYVGGRFPSVLTYDRRFFPHKMTSLYSGARISALTTISSHHDAKHTLVAAGEYKGKGSLELYPLSNCSSSQPRQDPLPMKNRASASRCKLLSIIPHGTRLLFSDVDGQVKWVERDGTTLARRWNINNWSIYSSDEACEGVFNAGADEGELARKMLALDQGEKSDVLVWTGSEIGLMGFSNKSRFSHHSEEGDKASSGLDGALEDDEKMYGRMMRRALERQANEVRFMRGLGLAS